MTQIDVATVVRRALADHILKSCLWDLAGRTAKFSRVYDDWPDFNRDFNPPSASILVESAEVDASGLAPYVVREIEAGSDGILIVKDGEWLADLMVDVWTSTIDDMDGAVRSLQEVLNPDQDQYGLRLPLGDSYFGATAQFTYKGEKVLQTEERTIAGIRRTSLTVGCQGEYLRAVRAKAFAPKVMIAVGQDIDPANPKPSDFEE